MKMRDRFCLLTIFSPGAIGKSIRNACNTGGDSSGPLAVVVSTSHARICARWVSCKVGAVYLNRPVGTNRHASGDRGQSPLPFMPLKTFIDVAPDSHFPLENLPFGVFQPKASNARVGVAIGDLIVDLSVLEELGHFRPPEFQNQHVFSDDSLNAFLALGRPAWRKTREVVQHVLSADTPTLRDDAKLRARVFHAQKDVFMKLPARIGNYTDFYSSYHHAHNVGTMLRGAENALMPNWKWLPVAYHGRASSIVASGAEVRRPHGQTKPPDAQTPIFGPSRSLDYELEMAFLIGPGNSLGEPVPIDRARDHIFGLVLMNDWSARDLQAWEYQPLGPFLAKNFCTSISPWVVMLEALEPFRKPLPSQDPEPLPYLRAARDFTYDIQLEAR